MARKEVPPATEPGGQDNDDLGLWSKIHRRIWNDEKFRSLSHMAQLVFFRLLTGPELNQVPGLIAANDYGLARAMKLLPERFRELFGELEQNGMANADWDAGLVFIPKAIFYNPPANPNMVKGWRKTWHDLPECPLKDAAFQVFADYLGKRSKAKLDAFLNGCGNGSRNGYPNRMGNQEQEQEQEQEGEKPARARAIPPPLRVVPALEEVAPAAPPLPKEPQSEPGQPISGHALKLLFGRLRAEVFVNALPWSVGADPKNRAGTFLESLDADARQDIEPTMRLMLGKIKAGKDKRWAGDPFSDPSFAFAAWMSGFTALREELLGRGRRAPAKPATGRLMQEPTLPPGWGDVPAEGERAAAGAERGDEATEAFQ